MDKRRIFILSTFLLFWMAMDVCAYDFMERSRGVRIYYNVVSETERTVEVTHGEEGALYEESSYTIPRSIRHGGKRYRVVAIGKRAFADCRELRSVTFSSNITRIDSAAFSHCESLSRLKLPANLQYIGDDAFAFCDFPYVEIPASVSHVGKGAFSYCPFLVDIMVDERNKTYSDNQGSSCIVEKVSLTLIQGCKNTLVRDGIRIIGPSAFAGCVDLQSLALPSSVVEIGEEAFRSSGLTSLTLPDGIMDLRPWTFFNCRALVSVHLPYSLLTIGERAFDRCPLLKNMETTNPLPVPLNENAFPTEVFGNAVLKVPIGADGTYRTTKGWQLFKHIVF